MATTLCPRHDRGHRLAHHTKRASKILCYHAPNNRNHNANCHSSGKKQVPVTYFLWTRKERAQSPVVRTDAGARHGRLKLNVKREELRKPAAAEASFVLDPRIREDDIGHRLRRKLFYAGCRALRVRRDVALARRWGGATVLGTGSEGLEWCDVLGDGLCSGVFDHGEEVFQGDVGLDGYSWFEDVSAVAAHLFF